MSSADAIKPKLVNDSLTSGALWRSIYLPYLLLAAFHIPLLFVYVGRDLASELRPHYHFYPFLAAGVAFLLWERWPRSGLVFRRSDASIFLFVLSGLGLLMALLFMEAAFAAVSFCLGFSSFLLLVHNHKTGGSLFPISILPYILCHSPFGEDRLLITRLQVTSSRITSSLLDMFGIFHDMPGTVLQTAGKQWGVEEACSGVQSFFTILFCSLFWAIWMQRPLFRGALLVASSLFWAIVMNTIRIFLIPFMYVNFDVDLSVGFQHGLLGYFTLVVGILLMLSTDQFLAFVFGEIDSDKSGTEEGYSSSFFWNRYIAGIQSSISENWTPQLSTMVTRWSLAGVMLIASLMSAPSLLKAFTADGVSFFSSNVILRVDEDWMPKEIDGWQLVNYDDDTRTRHSDLGQRSNVWTYSNGKHSITFSFDQVFPGWHELTHCYEISPIGWQIDREEGGRQRLLQDIPGTEQEKGRPKEASLVAVNLVEANAGLHSFLVFGLDDIDGNPIEAPGDWSFLTAFVERLKNRLSYEVRKSVVRGEAYQTQLFVQHTPSDEERMDYIDLYTKMRAKIEKQISERSPNPANFLTQSELEDLRRIQEREEAELEEARLAEKDDQEANGDATNGDVALPGLDQLAPAIPEDVIKGSSQPAIEPNQPPTENKQPE